MKCTEITLKGHVPLAAYGQRLGAMEYSRFHGADLLKIDYEHGPSLELPNAVDVSEQIDQPRVFVIEGETADTFLIFGGPTGPGLLRVSGVLGK